MKAERWDQIKELFSSALERDPRQRSAFLREACGGDDALRAEVESLLASYSQANSFIEKPAAESTLDAAEEALTGRRIGSYQVIREIGSGGMAVVYLAVRADDQYRKRVAIKLVKKGVDLNEIPRRFRNERQTLAALDHPNIVKLLDGGSTRDGSPYLVMDYVQGMPITDYCDGRRLSVTERLELFRIVCGAVHYAHQNLVIHRDLKPGNILVTAEGVPKLLDFGIAKLLNPEFSAQTLLVTQADQRLMTPEYASPEQVRGQPITTATDVYSLGVLLYELLTGNRPYRLKDRTLHEIERAICEVEPEKPSTVVMRGAGVVSSELVSQTREGRPEKLRRRLLGDLDNVVLMALRKEPQRRYTSVEQFSQDIQRHLEGLPVTARQSTLGYRASKFIYRHKAGVAAAVLVILALVSGIVATTWEARVARNEKVRAERRFNELRELSKAVMFDFPDAIEKLPGSTSARELMVKRALKYLDSLAQEASDDPSLQDELANGYERIGFIQWNRYYANLGHTAGALDSYGKGQAIHEKLLAKQPKDAQIRRSLAHTYREGIGDLLIAKGNVVSALDYYRKALALDEELVAADPSVANRRELRNSYQRVGDTLGNPFFPNLGDTAGATEYYGKMQTISEALAVEDPSAQSRHDLGIGFEKLGVILEAAGDVAGALDTYRKEAATFESLWAAEPANAKIRRDLSISYGDVGRTLQAAGDPAGAMENYRKALRIFEELANGDPDNMGAQRDLAFGYENVGDLVMGTSNPSGAREYYRKALAIRERISLGDPQNAELRNFLSADYARIGNVLAQAHQMTDALENYRRVLEIREGLIKVDPANARFRADFCWTLNRLAELSVDAGKLDQARRYTTRLLSMEKEQAARSEATANDVNQYAWALLTCTPADLRDPTVALPYAKRAVEISKGTDPNILDTLALAYHRTGNDALAIETEQRALALVKSDSPLRRTLEANLRKFKIAAR